MNIYPLIFSNNNNYRISRHAIFWLTWIAYYTIFSTYNPGSSYPLHDRFFSALTEVSLSTIMDIIFCYAIIYFLIPKFLFKGKYISMILLWLLFSMIFIVAFEWFMMTVAPAIRASYHLPKPVLPKSYGYIFFSLFGQINMEGCMAAAIKLGKISFIKQKEIDLLQNEKAKLQMRSADEMPHVFLADIINRVETMAVNNPIEISGALKKIRNLMSNVIYDNTNAKVSLKSELDLVKEYIELEKCTRDDTIKISVDISGETDSEFIASYVLLQSIHNAFNQVSVLNGAEKKIDIKVKTANNLLDVCISWNKPLYTSMLMDAKNTILQNLNKRLKLIYPGSHEMKMLIEVEQISMLLKIDLKAAIN